MGPGEQLLQGQGQAGLRNPGGFFFPRGNPQATLLKWLGKRDKEGEDGCRGAGLAPRLGWGSVGTGEGWELPRATSHTPHTHPTLLLPRPGAGTCRER